MNSKNEIRQAALRAVGMDHGSGAVRAIDSVVGGFGKSIQKLDTAVDRASLQIKQNEERIRELQSENEQLKERAEKVKAFSAKVKNFAAGLV